MDELIGPDTVNTAPPDTINAFRDHGSVEPRITGRVEEARQEIAALRDAGVDFDAVTRSLKDEGVEKFAKSFDSLLDTLDKKRHQIAA
jgi:transaldolase